MSISLVVFRLEIATESPEILNLFYNGKPASVCLSRDGPWGGGRVFFGVRETLRTFLGPFSIIYFRGEYKPWTKHGRNMDDPWINGSITGCAYLWV